MSTPIDFFFAIIFCYQNNVILTSYTIQNPIDP